MLTLSNILTGLSEHEMDRVLVLDERAGGGDCGSTKSSNKSSKRKSSGSHKGSSKGSSKRC